MDYTKVLGQLREARNRGLKAPVLLMGAINFRSAIFYLINSNMPLKVITILCYPTVKTGPYKMLQKLGQMVSSWSIFLPRRPLLSEKSAPRQSASYRRLHALNLTPFKPILRPANRPLYHPCPHPIPCIYCGYIYLCCLKSKRIVNHL